LFFKKHPINIEAVDKLKGDKIKLIEE